MDGFPGTWARVCPDHQRGRTLPVLMLASLVSEKHISVKVGSGFRVSIDLSVHQSQLQLSCCHMQTRYCPLHRDTWCLRTLGSVGRCVWTGVQCHCRRSHPLLGLWAVLQSPRGRAEDSEGETNMKKQVMLSSGDLVLRSLPRESVLLLAEKSPVYRH